MNQIPPVFSEDLDPGAVIEGVRLVTPLPMVSRLRNGWRDPDNYPAMVLRSLIC